MTPAAAVEQLMDLVPPPEQPVRPREIDWAAFARENGFAAPTDYRLLLEAYGAGSFGTSETPAGGWLYLHDPFEPGRTLVDRSDWERRNAQGLQRKFPEQYPGWPMWPQPGGLLPWGNTIDGDVVGWWTRGVPDEWGTRFFGRGDEFEEFRYGIAEFLLRLYRGELGSAELDGRLHPLDPGESTQFYPSRLDAERMPEGFPEEVTVTFSGLATVIDPAALPSPPEISSGTDVAVLRAKMDEHRCLWAEATRPADEIFESWLEGVKPVGFQLRTWACATAGVGEPLHHALAFSFATEAEPTIKRSLVELADRLGVGIAEVRNLEHERVWEDLTSPREG